MEASHSTPGPHSQMMESLFEGLQPAVQEALLLGSIPHVLDSSVADILFPAAVESNLKAIRSFRFSSETRQGQIEFHVLARRYLLNVWQRRNPARFRQISGQLAQEYQRRVEELQFGSIAHASEWMFHAMAANPADGLRLVINLFHELLESRELSSAERLIRLVQEQEPWIGEHSIWLDYFKTALAFSHYRDINTRSLEKLIHEHPNTLLAAYSLRLLGRIAIRKQYWAEGRNFLQNALNISSSLEDTYHQALVYMDMGDLFQNLVENSGGILVEEREFSSLPHRLFYELSRGPLALYRAAAERIDVLPKYYGMNYQNWIAIHYMRLSLRSYQSAEKFFKRLANRRAGVEIDIRKAKAFLMLGHSTRAHHICESALQDSLVQASPYYIASFQSILGETDIQQQSFSEAHTRLSDSLKTYEQYGDWDAVGGTTLLLGKIYEELKEDELALNSYRLCLKAAFNSQNMLLQGEVAHRLDALAQRNESSSQIHQYAFGLRRTINQLAFIDRYPGPVQAIFRKLANRIVYPFIFLFVIMLIAGGGISMQIIEGEFRFEDLPPLGPSDIFILTLAVLLPLLIIWISQLTYFLLGQLVIHTLPLGKVDESQPCIFVLNERNIIQKNSQGKIENWMAWEEIDHAIFDNRSLYRTPLAFSSRIELHGHPKEMLLPASTFRFRELEREIKHRLDAGARSRITQVDFSILRIPWLVAALLSGFAVSTYLVFGQGITGCYGVNPCPDELKTYAQPIIQYGLFFASLFFGIITWSRWKLADNFIKKARKHDT